MAKQRMTREEAILDILENAPQIGRRQAEDMVDKNIGDDPNYYKLEKEGAPEEIFYPTPEYSDESSPINRPFFHQYHEAIEPEEFDPKEFIKEIEEESKFDTSEFDPELHNVDAWFGGEPKEETKEERLERQIDRYNSMRDHVFDSDEGYMQGQDPESRTRQVENQELTQMVEALQRQAMQQGNVGAASEAPIAFSQDGFPFTPGGPNQNSLGQELTQSALQRAQMAGGVPAAYQRALEGGGLQSRPWEQGMNAQTMQSGVRPLMGIGGGNQSWGAGTWYPYRGNPYGG